MSYYSEWRSHQEIAQNVDPLVQVSANLMDSVFSEALDTGVETAAGIPTEREHALDMYCLVREISGNYASSELLAAAIGHDIERVAVSDAGRGFPEERRGPVYEAYKKQHARVGAEIATNAFRQIHNFSGSSTFISEESIQKIAFLIAHHDDTREEIEKLKLQENEYAQELEILVAADTLSFINCFAQNWLNGVEKSGVDGLMKKLEFMLRKMPYKYWRFISLMRPKDERVWVYVSRAKYQVASALGYTLDE